MTAYRVNADYEMQLFRGQIGPAALNQSIEFLLFFLSIGPLYTQKKYDPDYLEHVKSLTGRVPTIQNHGPYENWWGALKDLDSERWWNSKLTSTNLNLQKNWEPDLHLISSVSELKVLGKKTYLLKDPFAMSGQKFVLLTPEKEREEIIPLLSKGQLIAEPWLQRCYDFSQYFFPEGKAIAYENKVDEKFQYKGTHMENMKNPSVENFSFYSKIEESEWHSYRERTQEILSYFLQRPNQQGFSLDSFVYEEAGRLRIRTLCEINYRRTMGSCAFELGQKYFPEKEWSALILLKPGKAPLWKLQASLPEGIVILSPGDSRFEMVLLKAHSSNEGKGLLNKLQSLLPDTKFSIEI